MSEYNGAAAREKRIIRTSLVGIGANLGLAAFKALIGLLTHSIAVVLDAVNNLTDALSSVITILGARYSAKPADRKHPFGHGRIEYFASELIAMLVLYAGITALIESVKKILAPETPDYSAVPLIIIGAAVVVKILLGLYFKRVGKETRSEALRNSGEDATLDAVISASTLAAAALYMIFGWQLEAWLAAIISVVIIRSGILMLRDTLSQLLGERADSDLARGLKETIGSVDGVLGAYDLFLTDYGPDRTLGSVHVEVPDTLTAREVDTLARKISEKCLNEHGVILTAVGIYAQNTGNDEAARMQDEIRRMAMAHEGVLQLHGFYLDAEHKKLRFDVILDFALPDRRAVWQQITDEVRAAWPDWDVHVTLDNDISD